MIASSSNQNGPARHWVSVRHEPSGQYTAQAIGLPDVSATASSREEALKRVHSILGDLLASGQLVPIDLKPGSSLLQWFGHADPNDPDEQAYVDELERIRKEDLDQTLKELDRECSNSSWD